MMLLPRNVSQNSIAAEMFVNFIYRLLAATSDISTGRPANNKHTCKPSDECVLVRGLALLHTVSKHLWNI